MSTNKGRTDVSKSKSHAAAPKMSFGLLGSSNAQQVDVGIKSFEFKADVTCEGNSVNIKNCVIIGAPGGVKLFGSSNRTLT
jgi:hypothetical protein